MSEQTLQSGDASAAAAAAAALSSSAGDNNDAGDGHDKQQDEVRRQAAVRQGWKPQEQYDGDKEEWVDHNVFLDRAMQINPILRAKNARLESALERMERKLDEQGRTIDSFKKSTVTEVKRNLEADLIKLKAERATAINESDGDKVNDLDDKIFDTRTKLAQVVDPPVSNNQEVNAPPELREAAAAFTQRHSSWYGKDSAKTRVANLIGAEVRELHPELLDTPAFFDKVSELVTERLGLRDSRGTTVDSGGGTGSGRFNGSGGGKTYNNLPNDAKTTCDRQVENGLWKDRAEFVKYYFEDEERDKERGR